MSGLTLTLREMPCGGLDLSPLTPTALHGRDRARIERLRLTHGTRTSRLDQLFEISGTAGEEPELELRALTGGCHHVGHALDGGLLRVNGEVGNSLGGAMTGGEIRLRGNAGHGVGLGMRGGLITISGDAGDRVGGALPGSTRGMNEGTIIIRGNAGRQLGERMRRGLIVVGGNCDEHVGDRMIAGSIVVFGQCAAGAGLGMRRGTLLLAAEPAAMPATFNRSGEFDLSMITLLADYLGTFDKGYGKRLRQCVRVTRWCGDMAFGGKGEMLIATTD